MVAIVDCSFMLWVSARSQVWMYHAQDLTQQLMNQPWRQHGASGFMGNVKVDKIIIIHD